VTGSDPLESYYFHKKDCDDYAALYREFEWEAPDRFNIAEYACDRWADGSSRTALIGEDAAGRDEVFTFDDLAQVTDALAASLAERGVERGDRIGINVAQRPEAAMPHLAAWKIGAISVPLSTLYGPDGLRYRLTDASVRACIVDETNLEDFRTVKGELDLASILTVGETEREGDERGFWEAVENAPDTFENAVTTPDDEAIIIYTSGTAGDPKGALHTHSTLLGALASFTVRVLNATEDPNDVLWSPVEWSWIGTLFGVLFPALCLGKSMVAYHSPKFDPNTALNLMSRHQVTLAMFPPTAIRKMMKATDPTAHSFPQTRVIATGGEPVSDDLKDCVSDLFVGATIHEAYGQTEINGPFGECNRLYPPRHDAAGKPTPGHEVTILDPETAEPIGEPGTTGEIGVRFDGNLASFEEYWNAPELTAGKVKNGWLLTEDLGRFDDDGYIYFEGRKDSVIISSGYRIGPEEIEEVLNKHSAVSNSAVVGIPDDERGEVPKAYFTLAQANPPEDLKEQLQDHAKQQLAQHEYPHEIEILDEFSSIESEDGSGIASL
jgi:acetyl-CoA synthetase